MTKIASSLTTAFFCILFSVSVFACDKPEKPELPDPGSAVTPQMIKAKNDVKAYMTAAEAYLACGVSTKAHNSMVDDMNDVANDFNAIVKAFKDRMAG